MDFAPRIHKVALITGLLLLSNCSYAEYEIFDFKGCSHWELTVDFPHSEGFFYSDAAKNTYRKAEALLESMPYEISIKWAIYVAHDQNRPNAEKRVGVCSYSDYFRFECLPGFSLPISGGTFKDSPGDSFQRCVKGCKGLPVRIIYHIGNGEADDTEDEQNRAEGAYDKDLKQFRKMCGQK